MYTVQMEKECGCFKKSEYKNNMTFDTQKDAYQYANIVAEFMNEEFCGTHIFTAHRAEGGNFLITMVTNPDTVIPGYNPHITCDSGVGSTDKWSLEGAEKDNTKKGDNTKGD